MAVYPETFEPECSPLRLVVNDVFEKFINCGVLERGFARVRCDHCQHGRSELVARMKTWTHSGFNVHTGHSVPAENRAEREQLCQCVLRSPSPSRR